MRKKIELKANAGPEIFLGDACKGRLSTSLPLFFQTRISIIRDFSSRWDFMERNRMARTDRDELLLPHQFIFFTNTSYFNNKICILFFWYEKRWSYSAANISNFRFYNLDMHIKLYETRRNIMLFKMEYGVIKILEWLSRVKEIKCPEKQCIYYWKKNCQLQK